jgi:hypothetical protein
MLLHTNSPAELEGLSPIWKLQTVLPHDPLPECSQTVSSIKGKHTATVLLCIVGGTVMSKRDKEFERQQSNANVKHHCVLFCKTGMIAQNYQVECSECVNLNDGILEAHIVLDVVIQIGDTPSFLPSLFSPISAASVDYGKSNDFFFS